MNKTKRLLSGLLAFIMVLTSGVIAMPAASEAATYVEMYGPSKFVCPEEDVIDPADYATYEDYFHAVIKYVYDKEMNKYGHSAYQLISYGEDFEYYPDYDSISADTYRWKSFFRGVESSGYQYYTGTEFANVSDIFASCDKGILIGGGYKLIAGYKSDGSVILFYDEEGLDFLDYNENGVDNEGLNYQGLTIDGFDNHGMPIEDGYNKDGDTIWYFDKPYKKTWTKTESSTGDSVKFTDLNRGYYKVTISGLENANRVDYSTDTRTINGSNGTNWLPEYDPETAHIENQKGLETIASTPVSSKGKVTFFVKACGGIGQEATRPLYESDNPDITYTTIGWQYYNGTEKVKEDNLSIKITPVSKATVEKQSKIKLSKTSVNLKTIDSKVYVAVNANEPVVLYSGKGDTRWTGMSVGVQALPRDDKNKMYFEFSCVQYQYKMQTGLRRIVLDDAYLSDRKAKTDTIVVRGLYSNQMYTIKVTAKCLEDGSNQYYSMNTKYTYNADAINAPYAYEK